MLPRFSILFKASSASLMIVALLFLTTANFWAYGIKKDRHTVSSATNTSDEESGSNTLVPNPVEEKNSNQLQNLSEYLNHHHHFDFSYAVKVIVFGNRHDVSHLPIHHPELLTPPPKQVA